MVQLADYVQSNVLVQPFASPSYMSDEERLQQISFVMSLQQQAPYLYKTPKLHRRALEVKRIPDINAIFDENGKPVPSIEQRAQQLDEQRFQAERADAQAKQQTTQLSTKSKSDLNAGKIALQKAQIMKILADIQAEAKQAQNDAAAQEVEQVMKLMDMLIGAVGDHVDDVMGAVKMLFDQHNSMQQPPPGAGNAAGQPASPATLADVVP
jgi:multidrug efflux pump subunit AcrA (membrane-fusion protein)